jgi:hypothetical protein
VKRVAFALLLLAACKSWRRHTPADAGADATTSIVDAAVEAGAPRGPVYRSPTGGFEVLFPESKPPEVEEKQVAGGAIHLFKVSYGTSAYIVTYDDFARNERAPQQVLEGARDGYVESTGGTIELERPLNLEGHPGLELTVSATTSGIKMRQRARVYLVDGRLYQTLIVAPTWSGATQLEQDFLDSFKLQSSR